MFNCELEQYTILCYHVTVLYFNRAPFMLAHCLIDDICLPVFENIYILIIVLLCLFIYVFILYIYFLGNKCAIVCFNVSILGKYYIYMYYNGLPNKLTHSLTL